MSGITPILDTLLHQVLGKRVDVPSARPLTEPVQPTDPNEALRSLQSDSRLDARQPPLAPLTGAAARGLPSPAAQPTPQGGPPPSTTTHFSPTATTIADLLVKFPAPPSAIRPATPLIPTSESIPAAPKVAERLQASIRESGSFYESHLGKWFRGELSRQALEREPQMLRTQTLRTMTTESLVQGGGLRTLQVSMPAAPFMPKLAGYLSMNEPRAVSPREATASAPVASQSAASAGASQGAASAQQAVPSTAPLVPPGAASSKGSDNELSGHARQATATLPADPVSESLQGIVRHQLELLVSPVLRWEGDVWSGLFMALAIQVPQLVHARQGEGQSQGQGGDENEDPAWNSQLTLTTERLGTVGVHLRLKSKRVTMTLTAHTPEVAAQLEDGLGLLKQRLERCGIEEAALRVNLDNSDGPQYEA
ncbi:flagellar hook-length control protein FliK [Litchfieldella xinjiangensis]|uniref:flagellar hook-length control protein FliK n=1 Tax=Litchfieldella xinjiangensis TaxID=1166948 RepID=UPI000693E879|nr:flagellar hook-length control protein FliK [Halomonas xinjiangensis]